MKVKYIEDPVKWASEFKFHVDVKVRFSETDMYGHMNNTVPFIYFEYARIEFLKSIGFVKWGSTEDSSILVVADLQCDFLQQAFFDEVLKIYVKVNSVGTSSFDIHYLAKNEKDQPVFTGRGSLVQLNPKTGKSVPLTEEEKKKLLEQ